MSIPYQLVKTRQDELLRPAARDRLTRPGPANPPPAAAHPTAGMRLCQIFF